MLALVDADPALGEPLAGRRGLPARPRSSTPPRHEGARHLDDVLTRRTRISIETFDRGRRGRAGRGRADGRRARLGRGAASTSEVEHYLRRVEAERQSQEQPDDQAADAARLGAPDIVPLA